MQPVRVRRRSGSGAEAETRAASRQWTREWVEAEAVEQAESLRTARLRTRLLLVPLALLAAFAAVAAGIFPLTPGFSTSDTLAAVVAAAVTAIVTAAVVAFADRLGRALPRAGAGDALVFTAALASAGAAAIHFAVAKMHFDEYALFGVFFVGSGIGQLVWPVWLLLRRWTPLLVLGAVGNALIVALWAVDRAWGLPLGPTPWKPDPFGFGDSVASGLEVALVVACIALLVRGRRRTSRPAPLLALTLGTVVLTALSLLSAIGVASTYLTPAK